MIEKVRSIAIIFVLATTMVGDAALISAPCRIGKAHGRPPATATFSFVDSRRLKLPRIHADERFLQEWSRLHSPLGG
jgi:hypothetical protein